MELRYLGNSGLQVSALSFGAMTFGDGAGFFGRIGGASGSAAERQVDICLEAGVNLFDTANVYHNGKSEEVLGQALGARRKKVIIATKAYGRMDTEAHDIGLSRRHLIAACEDSLRRLGTDWIDLYQVHNYDGSVPLEETLRALDDLVTSGKVRYIGSSNFSGWHLMKASAMSDKRGSSRFISQQIHYSLLTRDAEQELLPCGIDQGVGAMIWSPLASGFLSGKSRTAETANMPSRLGPERIAALAAGQASRILDTVIEIANAGPGRTPSQVALNWLLVRPGVATVLVGARTDAQLQDNLGAVTWRLSAAELEALDRVSQTPPVYPNSHHRAYTSDRYPQLFKRHEGT